MALGSRYCSACDIAYPASMLTCRSCDNVLAFSGTRQADFDWQDRAAALAPRTIERIAVGYVRDENGRLWLYGCDLRDSGHREHLRDFEALELNDGVVVVVQLYDRPRQRYLVLDMPQDAGLDG